MPWFVVRSSTPGQAISLEAIRRTVQRVDPQRSVYDVMARFVRRLMTYGHETTHATLRRFYRAGQAEKIRLVAA